MTLYETIFARRSVRRYDRSPLGAESLDEVAEYAHNAKQIPGQSAAFRLADAGKLKGGLAPHAILAYSGGSDAAYVNIGYTLQGIDLWLQSSGYGSVWCGMARPEERERDYRILLGFGKTGAPLRKSESEFKRKRLSEISDADNAAARAARLAPSAVNLQPWKLEFTEGKVTVRSHVSGVGRLIPGRLYLFDLGIVTRHVEVALEHEGRVVTGHAFDGGGKHMAVEVGYA
jgi:hypothetical protein